MPDKRTTWIRRQRTHQPVVFYQDGHRRELQITSISKNGVSGYLVAPDSGGSFNDAAALGHSESSAQSRLSSNR